MASMTVYQRTHSARRDLRQQLQDAWQKARAQGMKLEHRLAHIEHQHLNPLLESLLTRWIDPRGRQQQQLSQSLPPVEISPETAVVNRGLYLSSASLGIAAVGQLLAPPLQLLSLPGLLYGTWHLSRSAYTKLVNEKTLHVDMLLTIVNLAYISGGYWVLGNLTITSFYFSSKLLMMIKDQLRHDLANAMMQPMQPVWVIIDGQEIQRSLKDLQPGDLVLVHAGETAPVDGVIQSGAATVDEQMLTGEAVLVEKGVGDRLYTSTLLVSGKVVVTVIESGNATIVARIQEVMDRTVDLRSGRQLQMQKLTNELVAPTLGLSAVTLSFLGLDAAAAMVNNHPYRQLNNFAALGIMNGFTAAAGQNILIKDGRSLELLLDIDTLIFDKTGTLTLSEPQLEAIHSVDNMPSAELLVYAAAAEQHQRHPIARAIMAAAQSLGISVPPIDEATFKVGLGLIVQVGIHTIHVGSARFMTASDIALPPEFLELQTTSQQQGKLCVWVARDGLVSGVLILKAPIRPEAHAIIDELRRSTKIRTVLLVSGDQPTPTQQAALAVGADGFHAEILPAGKAELIARLQAEGRKVCFVGDGINDAIALKQANVSVSMVGSTRTAIDTAHVVLMDEGLERLQALFTLAQHVADTQRMMMIPVLGTSILGVIGIFAWDWRLTMSTILDQAGMIGGTTVLLRQRLLSQRQLRSTHPA